MGIFTEWGMSCTDSFETYFFFFHQQQILNVFLCQHLLCCDEILGVFSCFTLSPGRSGDPGALPSVLVVQK